MKVDLTAVPLAYLAHDDRVLPLEVSTWGVADNRADASMTVSDGALAASPPPL